MLTLNHTGLIIEFNEGYAPFSVEEPIWWANVHKNSTMTLLDQVEQNL